MTLVGMGLSLPEARPLGAACLATEEVGEGSPLPPLQKYLFQTESLGLYSDESSNSEGRDFSGIAGALARCIVCGFCA